MDQIRRQVAAARRRMVMQQFLKVAPWCLFGTLVVAALALAIPKIWALGIDTQTWTWSWIGGACTVGMLIAIAWTFAIRRGSLDAAIEIDRRFGLKERVSSALALQDAELQSEAGRALVDDASRRIEMVVVGEKFGFQTGWRSLLPVMPAVAAFVLAFFVPDMQNKQASAAAASTQQKQQIKKSSQELKKKLEKRREEAEKKGLQDAEELFRKLTKGIDDMNKKDDLDQRKALVKLNDLAKELEKRRDSLGDPDKMKQQFERLKNLEKGPADKMAEAMKEGNFQKALEELKQLQEKLEKGELAKEDQEKLARQMEQMSQKMREMVEAHQDAKRELKRKIDQKMAQGDMEAVNKLQKQLDQLEKADKQMSRMEELASKLDQAQKALKEGDSQKASSEMSQLQKDLDAMSAEMEQLETLNELMDELANAKSAMNCQNCDGTGCEECQGDMYGAMGEQGMDAFAMGQGMGEGQGRGERPEQETATGAYDSRLRATPKAGEAVRVGDAGGPNQTGKSTESIKEQIQSSLSRDSDALTDQRLPRSQQDHVREYYDRLRKGE